MKNRKFLNNKFAVSLMYDAVLFITMVSLSGVVLLPALTSNIAIDASVEKHREEIVDEALLMLMTTRVDDFEYVFAGSQIDNVASSVGIDTNDQDGLYNSITKQFLGKEQIHKTYIDLCVENLISQIKIFNCRVNIFTEDYDICLKNKISILLNNYMGNKYNFNLTARWLPVNGLEFGGEISIGPPPSKKDTYVAKSYVTMPTTVFSKWENSTKLFIDEQIYSIERYLKTNENKNYNETEFKKFIKESVNITINNIIFDGFKIGDKNYTGFLNTSLDYAFEKIQGSISDVFGNSLCRINDFLEIFETDLGFELDKVLSDNIKFITNIDITDLNNDSQISIDDVIIGLKKFTIEQGKNKLNDIFNNSIESLSENIVQEYNSFKDVDMGLVKTSITNFYNKQINVLTAEVELTIWEAY